MRTFQFGITELMLISSVFLPYRIRNEYISFKCVYYINK